MRDPTQALPSVSISCASPLSDRQWIRQRNLLANSIVLLYIAVHSWRRGGGGKWGLHGPYLDSCRSANFIHLSKFFAVIFKREQLPFCLIDPWLDWDCWAGPGQSFPLISVDCILRLLLRASLAHMDLNIRKLTSLKIVNCEILKAWWSAGCTTKNGWWLVSPRKQSTYGMPQ